MLSYNINQTTVTVVINSDILTMNTDDTRYSVLLGLLGNDGNEQEIYSLFEETSIVAEADRDEDFVRDVEGNLTYNGVSITGQLHSTLVALLDNGFNDLERYKLFINNLRENPSASSVRELYDFMAYDQLPISSDGCLIAYKGVMDNYFSSHGNKDTIVNEGVVNERFQIRNQVGDVISVDRNQVDDTRQHHCSFGLHVGSLDYAKSFGCRVIAVKVNPKDVVSVPEDCACQKMRVSKYDCLEEIENKIETICPSDDQPLKDQRDNTATVAGLTNEELGAVIVNLALDQPYISIREVLIELAEMIDGETCFNAIHLLSIVNKYTELRVINNEDGSNTTVFFVAEGHIDEDCYDDYDDDIEDEDDDDGEYNWNY